MHDLKKLEKEYTELLNFLLEDVESGVLFQDFLATLCSGEFGEWEYHFENYLDDIDLWTDSGVSKGVLWKQGGDYVLKIPFKGDFPNRSDFCKLEVENYERACVEGLESCFAWCAKLMDFTFVNENGVEFTAPIYIMSYVNCDENELTDIMYSTFLERGYSELDLDSTDLSSSYNVEYYLETKWGDDLYCDFECFCSRNHINDLHAGNIGVLNENIVCIDYSGYGLVQQEMIKKMEEKVA